MIRYDRKLVKGFLHTKGTKIVNGDGEEILLNGYGHGTWTNPEGFMVGAPVEIVTEGGLFSKKMLPPRRFDRRRTFHQVVVELCGTEYAKNFWPRWYKNQLAEADIQAMAELGANCVRLPINSVTLLEEEPGLVWNEAGFAMIDQVLEWCEIHKIYAVLDLHGAPGGQSGTACDGGLDNFPHLFIDDESRERALALWEKLAMRYADRWIVGAYDLLNEPLSLPNLRPYVPNLAAFYDEAIARIRKYDTKHMLTLEGSCFSRSNEIFDHNYDPYANNWCIHIHMYDASPEKKELYPYLLKGMEYHVPVWIGEGGSTCESNEVFFGITADYGIGFCLWSWKMAMNEGIPIRGLGYTLPKNWEAVRSYCAGGPKPSYERSQSIFNELLENVKIENCYCNKEFLKTSKRFAPLSLPAVGYDNLPGLGYSFSGHWEYGNLLNYRLEDHTKLVWDRRFEEPRPGFDAFDDENIQKEFDPLEMLLLELGEGEFAVYTIYGISGSECLSLTGQGEDGSEVLVYCNDCLAGTITFSEKGSEDTVILPACDMARIKLLVKQGVVTLKKINICEE